MNISEKYVLQQIESFGLSEFDRAIEKIQHYRLKSYYRSKNKRLSEWQAVY